MDPLNALVLSAPPEWIPVMILAAILLKAWTAWLDKKKTGQLLDAKPNHEVEAKVEATDDIEEITKDPNVKG